MAKSKKSKILASMLAVSTMAVFYVAPVMAAQNGLEISNSNIEAEDRVVINGVTMTGGRLGVENGIFAKTLNINGYAFTVDKYGNTVSKGDVTSTAADGTTYTLNTIGSDLDKLEGNVGTIGDNVKHIEHYDDFVIGDNTYDATVIEGSVAITNERGIDVIGDNGASMAAITKDGVARFGAQDAQYVRIENGELELRNNWTTNVAIRNDGTARFGAYNDKNILMADGALTINNNDDDNPLAKLSEEGLMLSDEQSRSQTLTATKIADIQGINRDPVAETTTIEGDFAVNGKDNTFGSANGSFTVDAEDGTFTAAKGAFKVREGVGETVIAGSIISSEDILGNYGSLNGSQLTLRAKTGESTLIDAGRVSIDNGSSSTIISGGAITAKTLNGKVIDNLVEGSDIADDLANIGGITREAEDGVAPGKGTTTIENNLKVSGDKISMFDDNGLTFERGTMDNFDVIKVNGKIGFDGSNVHFSYGSDGSDGKTTTLGDLALTVDQIATDVSAIKEKTDHITVDDKGNVTISADDGSSLTVGNGGTSTGQGGQVTTDGDHNVTGDMNVDGSLTVGDTEGSQTIIEDDKVTTGEISADKGNIGNSHFNENGITVGAAGGQHTTITDTTVDATNGYFDNLQADKANIGGVGLEDETVTADKVVTGNTTLDNEGLNVGGQTSVTADGVNVGGNGGTTVSKDGVSIADKTIISDHDVVINEGTADRVSLSETADRVGNLEQGVSELNNRVGELEDRIDKVGAMAAAIANLRTMGYDPAAPTEVAVGIGQYRDETGAALGLFHYPNRDFMLSLSVSTSGDEVMGGIGATWKFGRKSPEKVAEIKKAQAEADARRAEEAKLAKAEEMKQAAKEAKIKAQQERHAKLAAERAAQAEAAK